LKWCLQSPFLILHFIVIDLQEAKDSIDEEDPRPTSSTWSSTWSYKLFNFCFNKIDVKKKITMILLKTDINLALTKSILK